MTWADFARLMGAQGQAEKARRRAEYLAYLDSPEWAVLRRLALAAADHRCQVCNSGDSLDVHHRTYERFREEILSDLTVLCRVCHDRHHDAMKKPAA